MMKFPKPMSFKNKLFFTYVILFLSILLCSIVTVFGGSIPSQVKNNVNYEQALLNQTSLRVDDYLKQVNSLCVQLSYSRQAIQILKKNYHGTFTDAVKYTNDREEIFNLFSGYSNILSGVESVFLFNQSGYPYYFSRLTVVSNLNAHSQEWYPELVVQKNSGQIQFSPIHLPNEFSTISTKQVVSMRRNIRRPGSHVNDDWLGQMEIQIRPSIFDDIIRSSNREPLRRHYTLLDQNGAVIYSSREDYLPGQAFSQEVFSSILKSEENSIQMFQNDELVCSLRSDYSGWYLVSETDWSLLLQEIYKTLLLLLPVFCLCLIMILIVGFLVSREITRPLKLFTAKVEAVERGNFDTVVSLDSDDEFGQLAMSFNHMTEKIKESIDRIYETEKEKHQAEITAMQAQINPHFTLNTLNTIKYIAILQNSTNIVDMLEDFSMLIKAALNDPNELITFAEEFRRIRAFIRIQDVSSLGKIKVELEYEDSILEYLTMGLILQPIVENSVFHGIRPKMESHQRQAGQIKIHAVETDGLIEIHVRDDGIGIPRGEIGRLLRGEGTGIGVSNVNKRIQLRFGNPYGLSIESDAGKGCDVLIKLPKITKGENDHGIQ